LTLATIFVFASFLPKVSKRLKVEFWSLEMVKIGRGQQNYGCLEKFQKKLAS
jgi:hypothetical protein